MSLGLALKQLKKYMQWKLIQQSWPGLPGAWRLAGNSSLFLLVHGVKSGEEEGKEEVEEQEEQEQEGESGGTGFARMILWARNS